MKDKALLMYDHIRSAVDVDPWAIRELKRVMDTYLADGCSKCAFEHTEEWELPCRKCRRNCKDYWRAKEDQKTEGQST